MADFPRGHTAYTPMKIIHGDELVSTTNPLPVFTGSYPMFDANEVIISNGSGDLTSIDILPITMGGTGTNDFTLLDDFSSVAINFTIKTLENNGEVIFRWGDFCELIPVQQFLKYDFEVGVFMELPSEYTIVDLLNGHLYSTNYQKVTVDFKNGFMNDNNELTTVAWFDGLLYGENGSYTVDWKNCIARRNSTFDDIFGWDAGKWLTLYDGVDLDFQTTTGTKIGRSSSQKLALWGKTPIVQPTTSITGAAFVANAGTAINSNSTFGGYTQAQIAQALINVGILT